VAAAVSAGVRRAGLRDLDAVAALWTVLTAHHEKIDPVFAVRGGADLEIRRLVEAMLRDPDGAVFVCESKPGGLLGFCVVRVDRAPPILVERERAEITDLLVRASARRSGLGRKLVESASAWVKERGLDRCEVRVAAHNEEGQAFWRALGFGDLMDVLQRPL
jgi:ribosomal protein S18 acetylase RimI-like enzyme